RALLGGAGGLLEWGVAGQRRGGAGLRRPHDLCRKASARGSRQRDVQQRRATEERREEDVGRATGAAAEFAQVVRDHRSTRTPGDHPPGLTSRPARVPAPKDGPRRPAGWTSYFLSSASDWRRTVTTVMSSAWGSVRKAA